MSSNKQRTNGDTESKHEKKQKKYISEFQLDDLPEEILSHSFDCLGLMDRTKIQSVSQKLKNIAKTPYSLKIDQMMSKHKWVKLSRQFPDILELSYLPQIGYSELQFVLSLWPKMNKIYIEHLILKHKSFLTVTDDLLIIDRLTLDVNHGPIPRLPPNVKKLIFGIEFDLSIANIILPRHLTHITFGFSFDQQIDHIVFPIHLTHMLFGYSFNRPIEDVIFPNQLTDITFGHSFNRPIDKIGSLRNLTNITFGWSYNQRIQKKVLHEGLTHLTLDFDFKYNIGKGVLPNSLTHLNLKNELTQEQIETLVFPPMLTHLIFENFMGPIAKGFLSDTNLTSLVLGPYFNRNIEEDDLPFSLTHLTLGKYFNNRISLPGNLSHLTLGRAFDRPIDFLHEGLTHLAFDSDSYFNQVIGHDDLPESLTYLSFGYCYKKQLKEGVLKDNLIYLKFGFAYNKTIHDNVLPLNLQNLTLGSSFRKKIQKGLLPIALTHLNIDKHFQYLILDGIIHEGLTHITLGTYVYDGNCDTSLENHLNQIITAVSLPVSLKNIVFKASSDRIWEARKYFRKYDLLPNRWNLLYDLGKITLTKY